MQIDVLTLFPDMFKPILGTSIPARAEASGAVQYHVHDLREWTTDKHRTVDDRPFGGGPGMVMMCQPLWDAVHAIESRHETPSRRLLLSPQGTPLTQRKVEELADTERIMMVAGHYEGVDERAVEALELEEISIGDYVLSGGEIPAMVLLDSIVRLLPGVLGHEDSAAEDSFSRRDEADRPLLDCPHYTRPRNGARCRFPTSSSAVTMRPSRGGVKTNRSSGRDGVAPTSWKNRDPWANRIDPCRGNPTAESPLKGNNRATARETCSHESHHNR